MSRLSVIALALCFCLPACYRGGVPSIAQLPAGGATAAQRYAGHGYKTIFAFDGAHGSSPNSPLTIVRGEFYGTTAAGGDWSTAGGTAFALTTAGKEKVLHSFGKGNDGKEPVGNLTLVDGTLYGATAYGGKYGSGTVFSMTLSGTENVLHSFGKGKDGKQPAGGVTALNGVLYGMTDGGGKGSGVLYSLTTAGEERVLYDFPKGYTNVPPAAMISLKGMLYGTRSEGGCGNNGVAFSATTAGSVHFIHAFGGQRCSIYEDGHTPSGTLIAVKGTLYGTTFEGGGPRSDEMFGSVYSLTPSGKERVVHGFGEKTDGRYPECTLLPTNGALYGVTIEGGANEQGIVFSVTPSGTEHVLYNFGYPPDGGNPDGGLVDLKGVLYGTTRGGGGKPYGVGTVFSIVP